MRIAVCQSDVAFSEPEINLNSALARLDAVAGKGVDLVLFPEAYLTGYVVNSSEEAEKLAMKPEAVRAALERLQAKADQHKLSICIGYIDEEGGAVYNSAALIMPCEAPRIYRKTHLPYLGVDNFVTPGSELDVFDTKLGKIGLLVCFDLRVPEAARTLALKGADIILLPTNWPSGSETTPKTFAPVRAAENRIFLAACNRVGQENGVAFFGSSVIYGPDMDLIASAGSEEEMLIADLDLTRARNKRRVITPGVFETDTFATRQPKLYSC